MPLFAFHSLWCTLSPFGQFWWWWQLLLNSTILRYGSFHFRYVLLPLKNAAKVKHPPSLHLPLMTSFNNNDFRNFTANQKSTQQTISEAKNAKRRGLNTLSFACISGMVSKRKLQLSIFEIWICYCNRGLGFLIMTNWQRQKDCPCYTLNCLPVPKNQIQ